MKSHLLFLIMLLTGSVVTAQDEQRITSQVTQVTLFLSRAQLNTQARATINAGTTRVIVENASSETDPQSIQVSGRGNAIIQGVQFRTNFLTNVAKPQSLQRLEDSLRTNRDILDALTLQREVLENEKKMILANQKVGGEKGATVDAMEAMADFYRKRLTEIGKKMLSLEKLLTDQKQRVDRLEGQVNEQNAHRNRPVGEIEVTLVAQSRTTVELNLSYVVASAGWTPFYDIRVKDTKGSATLAYKAYVYQNTGFDWQNVKLILSTANPAQPGTQPQLETQFVGFYEAPRPLAEHARVLQSKALKADAPEETLAAAPVPELANTAAFTQVTDQSTSINFEIAVLYTILANNKPQVVDIQVAELKTTYRYIAIPKIDSDAFLVATLIDWEKLNLLNGPARIYFEGTYVGESQIAVRNGGDTLTVSLGRDKKVLVKREKTQDFSSRKSLSSTILDTYSYRITARNTKNEAVMLTIYDQIPVSTDNRIEVELERSSQAERNAENGQLSWSLTLKPGESRELTFHYTVRYPKGRQLVNEE